MNICPFLPGDPCAYQSTGGRPTVSPLHKLGRLGTDIKRAKWKHSRDLRYVFKTFRLSPLPSRPHSPHHLPLGLAVADELVIIVLLLVPHSATVKHRRSPPITIANTGKLEKSKGPPSSVSALTSGPGWRDAVRHTRVNRREMQKCRFRTSLASYGITSFQLIAQEQRQLRQHDHFVPRVSSDKVFAKSFFGCQLRETFAKTISKTRFLP
ncbi:hypothetical protein VTK73DRAFT_8331 [Phialemonium thermophilum]|uniref:Uncharacterized protein n=1 Tax=Phialemonium thermophilum TaxID=223376 RepID=A0ABR3Y667_9PEZI